MKPLMQSCLLRLIQLPTVVRLRLNLMRNFNPGFILPCSNLKDLTLRKITYVTEGFEDVFSNLLQHLSNSTDWASTVLRISRLQYSCPAMDVRIAYTPRWIYTTSKRLTLPCTETMIFHLYVNSSNKFTNWNTSLFSVRYKMPSQYHFLLSSHPVRDPLSDATMLAPTIAPSLKTLKHLKFHISIDSNHVDPLSEVCEIFQNLAGRNHIEIVVICIEI